MPHANHIHTARLFAVDNSLAINQPSIAAKYSWFKSCGTFKTALLKPFFFQISKPFFYPVIENAIFDALFENKNHTYSYEGKRP